MHRRPEEAHDALRHECAAGNAQATVWRGGAPDADAEAIASKAQTLPNGTARGVGARANGARDSKYYDSERSEESARRGRLSVRDAVIIDHPGAEAEIR